jgi:DNA-binding NarL/FixJ family response regulator
MTKTISIILADDHAMVRGALGRTLANEADLSVVATVGSTDDAVSKSAELKPDVILLDIDMPGMVCFDAARRIQNLSPETRVVFLSAFFHDRYIEQAISVQAWGYIVKTEPAEVVADVVRKVVAGQTYFSPEVQSRLVVEGGVPRPARPNASRASSLTDREIEVLRCIARGLSEKEIAKTMHISPHTVHRHTTNLKTKLDIYSRVELARYAIREGLAEA